MGIVTKGALNSRQTVIYIKEKKDSKVSTLISESFFIVVIEILS